MADVRARGGKPESFAPFADETDARKLSYLAFQIDALKDLGITDIRFAPLLHGADAQTLFMWRSDLETISAGAGRGASILVENGIVQMQPHLANFRFKRVAHRQRDLIPCDFENIRNLLVMTYPQAVGYIAGSLGNLINSSTNIERQGILTTLSPNILEAELRGFFIRFRGDGRLADTIALGRKTIAGGDGIDRNAVDYLLAESMETPITELRHPFISLLMDAYPEARHNEMQQRIHAR
jgi:hypothetical protein